MRIIRHSDMSRPVYPIAGTIRLFDTPPNHIVSIADRSLSEWIDTITFLSSSDNVNHRTCARDIEEYFFTNQRKRYLAFKVLRQLTQRVWGRKIQCNIDLIDFEQIPPTCAIYMTDTVHRTIFRFHRRDILKNLTANLSQCVDMIARPRQPTNPFTNSILTYSQTVSLCQQLMLGFTRHCPPTLFAAFWAAGFDIHMFQEKNSAILSQNAITAYFSELTNDNYDMVFETIISLLTVVRCTYSKPAVKKWLVTGLTTQTSTGLHKDWLHLVRDYSLYINMYVQARPHWTSLSAVYTDVIHLYNRTTTFQPKTPTMIPAVLFISNMNLLHAYLNAY